MYKYALGAFMLFFLASCSLDQRKQNELFEELSADKTHLSFQNEIRYDKDFNIFRYRNFYNGGGVAIGDINNDGLSDIYVSSNFDDNKLYLNKGNWEFEDITQKAGVKGQHKWSTGVTFADVNGDGLMDIYVCNSGNRATDTEGTKDDRANELYINTGNKNGIPTFTEQAKQYGLDDRGFSTHAAFFDYDRDGDLDIYLLNNSFTPISKLQDQNLREYRDNLGGDKLFRNDSPTLALKEGTKDSKKPYFTDISAEAGIYGSLIGFGLGITIGDVNNDNWPDIYISNDFYERDYLYINQKNGKFKEDIKNQMGHISSASMGADIADINNDGNLDIFVTDMLPGDDRRLKTTSTFEDYNYFQSKLKKDFYYQYMHNMLQLNNGDGSFSEIGALTGMHATDWSWGALIFDMDNDGKKDVFVANGIAKDLTDQDFVTFLASEQAMQQAIEIGGVNYKELIDKISSKPIPNYAFRNEGNLKFSNSASNWGLGKPGFSNGAAYGDLDNDGDLDLIVNNVNAPLGVFKNRSVENNKTHFLKINLKGTPKNIHGIGAKVSVYQGGNLQCLQQMPNRGFQSSSDNALVFGLGDNAKIDSIQVLWPDDKMQTLAKPMADKVLSLDHQNANQFFVYKPANTNNQPLQDFTTKTGLGYKHQESTFVDYYRDVLLKQQLSTQGPALAVGDVNADGLDDVYFGGAAGSLGKLFVQAKTGKFTPKTLPNANTVSEEVSALFFDADQDKDLDLLIVTGSNEFMPDAPELADKLYLNDGKGNFSLDEKFPRILANGSCAVAADIDADGDQDLFIGSRMVSGEYGISPQSYLLINNGKGGFKDETKRLMPQASALGMVTDATFADINNDRQPDLVVTQDWGAVQVFKNEAGGGLKLQNLNLDAGWWNCLKASDIDGDGDLDFILGNLGQNSRIKANDKQPAELWTNDFDKNGKVEQIITCYTEDGRSYPMVQKPDLQKELPIIKKKFLKHADYAGKSIQEIFDEDQLKDAVVRKVSNGNSCFMINEGNFKFSIKALPIEAQFAPIHGIELFDYNNDGKMDVFLAGNFYDLLPELGRYDANYGLVLTNKGQGNYAVTNPKTSGFFVKGQVRNMKSLKTATGNIIVLAKNNDNAQVFGLKEIKK